MGLAPPYYRLLCIVRGNHEIQGDVGEGGLKTDPGGNVYVEDELLQGLLDLLVAQPVIPDERCEKRIEIGDGLGPRRFALKGIEEVHQLTQGTSEMLRRSALDLSPDALETLHNKIVEVPPHAIYRQHAQIVHVEISPGMGLPDLRGINVVEPVLFGDLRRYIMIETLQRIGHIAVLIDLPIHPLQVLPHKVHVGPVGDLPEAGMLLPVDYECLCGLSIRRGEQYLLHYVLNVLNGGYFG